MFNIASVINVRLTELFHWYGDRRHVEGDERFAFQYLKVGSFKSNLIT